MPRKFPTPEEWNKAKEDCDAARKAVSDKWYGLSEEQRKKLKEAEFDYVDRIGDIDEDVPEEQELTDEAIAALESAKSDYNELLTELNDCISEL